MTTKRYTRKVRSVQAARGKQRIDITLPDEVLDAAKIRPGDYVEIHATPAGRIVLAPLRATWPHPCPTVGCVLAKRHEGDCVPDDDVPY